MKVTITPAYRGSYKVLRSFCLIAAAVSSTPLTTHAVEWDGEGTLSAGFSSGNSNTSDAGIGIKTQRDGIDWRTNINATLDYGETEGIESKNRTFVSLQSDRKFARDIWSAYGRTSFERNEVAGLQHRIFLGTGLGYRPLDGDIVEWSLEGSPGIKFERRLEDRDTETPYYDDTETFAMRAGSRFAYQLNEHVKFANDTNLIYSDQSTQIRNDLSLTAALVQNISARLSFDVRHDTEPPQNVEPTDTSTRISLVYGFGG